MRCIGVLTSGGDAPGMNAAIRAVTRTAIFNHLEVKAVYHGYNGLITGDIRPLQTEGVSNIIQRGGTILKTARSEGFTTPEGRRLAYENIQKHGIEGLVVIGGDGTFTGAEIFGKEYKIPIIGVPGTIDNDLYGTDFTIGYDTALNTIMQAVDKIRDTASSHERLFVVEVMGRDAGFLALYGGIASGAEAAVIPEFVGENELLTGLVKNGLRKSKNSGIVLVSESGKTGGAFAVANRLKESGFTPHVTILGHVQRGGSPSAADRILASRCGVAAVDALIAGKRNCMIGVINGHIVHVPFEKAIKDEKPIDTYMVDVLGILSI
jgi:6-phosphofructokinase 1